MKTPMRSDDSKPIPTRFSSVELDKIDNAAAGLGLGRSAFIRFCVNMFLRAFEAGGYNVLPSNWEDIVRSLDNRTREGHGARWPQKGKGGTPSHKAPLRRPRK